MMPGKVGQELGEKQVYQARERALAVWDMLAFILFHCLQLYPLES